MEAARSSLEQKQTPQAARQAVAASKDLQEARKELARAIEQKKGEEAAEQQAAQPNEVDTENTLQQIAKALEQTKKAAEQSDRAAQQLNKPKAKQEPSDLVRMQKKIARQAPKADAAEASKPADKAAESLDKGDLEQAEQQQKKALEQLKRAAEREKEKDKEKQDEKEKDKQDKKEQEPKSRDKSSPTTEEETSAAQLALEQEKLMQLTRAMVRQREATSGQPTDMTEEGMPSLTELQQQVADQAPEVDAPEAAPPASAAADALLQGDLRAAVEQQRVTLGKLRKMAQKQGEVNQPMAVRQPKDAQTVGQLADAQEAILKATEMLALSEEANQAAMASVGQAQAQAPAAVQPQLEEASQQLAQAGQKLDQGSPMPANKAQGNARNQLEQALQSLKNALARGEQPGAKEGQGEKQGQGEKPGQQGQKPDQGAKPGQGQKPGQGMKPGMKLGQGMALKPGKGLEINEPRGSGQRQPDGTLNKSKSQSRDVRGEGLFIHLPPRQRQLIKQALDDKLPPEYAALIQQYYVNIARGKPDAMPAPRGKP
jgi:hypothetical protein